MIHLIAQLVTGFVWIIFIPFLLLNRKRIPVNIFYGMLFSTFMVVYSLGMELFNHNYDMSWNTWQWYPANIITTITFYLVVKSYSQRNNRIKCWIPKRLKFNNEKK